MTVAATSLSHGRCERRISRTGKVHFVSRRRQLQHQLVALTGYRRRPRQPPPRVGLYRWLSPVEQLRIRAEAACGVGANRIASRVGRDRRTIDRVLTDARGLRLALRLAQHRALWILVPDVLATLRAVNRQEATMAKAIALLEARRHTPVGVYVWGRTERALRQLEPGPSCGSDWPR